VAFWPSNGQTIGILAAPYSGGFDPKDITLYYQNLNLSLYEPGYYVQGQTPYTPEPPPPGATKGNLVPPTVMIASAATATTFATNTGFSDGEINMDISLSSSVAQGAEIAVYLFDGSATGWITALGQAIQPAQQAGQPPPIQPTVISTSYYFAGGDEQTGVLPQATWRISPPPFRMPP
jgi:hypothetical protein